VSGSGEVQISLKELIIQVSLGTFYIVCDQAGFLKVEYSNEREGGVIFIKLFECTVQGLGGVGKYVVFGEKFKGHHESKDLRFYNMNG